MYHLYYDLILALTQTVTFLSAVFQIKVSQATGLPQNLSNFVFCQYDFWGQEEPVFIAPEVNLLKQSTPISKEPHCSVPFDSCKVSTSSDLHLRMHRFKVIGELIGIWN